jgi:hypothetical protein
MCSILNSSYEGPAPICVAYSRPEWGSGWPRRRRRSATTNHCSAAAGSLILPLLHAKSPALLLLVLNSSPKKPRRSSLHLTTCRESAVLGMSTGRNEVASEDNNQNAVIQTVPYSLVKPSSTRREPSTFERISPSTITLGASIGNSDQVQGRTRSNYRRV